MYVFNYSNRFDKIRGNDESNDNDDDNDDKYIGEGSKSMFPTEKVWQCLTHEHVYD